MSLPAGVVERATEAMASTLESLLGDDTFVEMLLRDRIRKLVDAGVLVPRERLQIGVGIELAPAGLIQATRQLLDLIDAGETELGEAASVIEALFDAAKVTEASITTAPTVAEVEEVESAGTTCKKCGVDVEAEQALLSYTRWRHVLCPEHHADYDPEWFKEAS